MNIGLSQVGVVFLSLAHSIGLYLDATRLVSLTDDALILPKCCLVGRVLKTFFPLCQFYDRKGFLDDEYFVFLWLGNQSFSLELIKDGYNKSCIFKFFEHLLFFAKSLKWIPHSFAVL